ncbi:methyltransferase domain-containing protein [Marinovum sp. 2_MG-2023]|uniref:methyltransferase domain-containing protein n=1 Tax=unclassified Marinovum TaxID=2647166 RepID=UPI0026E18902|nr:MULTISPECIES: methyltransferase domain-containing protein [unclassified Marinovum]MDO6728565.1 methyltransferase domain-containing protein [Marinovum sp. 2_MG-2023]MDO6778019.1 methyltransferase domain-containing protein [Marinovum sp. 1_MG-2023]
MHLDVQDLRNFYYRSTLGRAAQKAVRERMLKIWPEAKGQTVAGYGFAVPLLRPYLRDARRVIAMMPGPQGVMPWPAGAPNVSVLTEETLWPIETGRIDKLLLLHGLETSERPTALLEECHRVLGPGGKVMFIVPNRAGLWSRSDATPFGFGRPYSQGQLETQLRVHGFMPEAHAAALYQPPSRRRFWHKAGPVWERMGQRFGLPLPAGVLMVVASKRVQAPLGPGNRVRVRNPLEVLSPTPAKGIKPV